ncbi:cell division protein FtsZ [Paraconexibacter algicola]|uniref:Cell division protein FtsZ n=1 Tax=Paraconexibacter algicola TaxID=2133960 RepID=A0A2T4UMM3_9ACTN|nr:cell division protein FtsZ [Paraconexibacter algicola]PTL60490.1 cell division protein FtsZ [Paraconexibacter algicola]
MESGKRASMREGPLAALFRKTEEVQENIARAEGAATEPPPPQASAPVAPPQAAAPAPAPAAPAPIPGQQELAPAPATPAARAQAGARGDYPHPSLGAVPAEPQALPVPEPAPLPVAEPFAAADPYARQPATQAPHTVAPDVTPPPAPIQHDPYARDRGSAWGSAQPVGQPVIRVVGVGGAGVNAVNRMVEAEVEGVEFIAVNTDVQSLQQSTADITLHIGPQITRGLGAGSNPELGRASAMEEYDKVKALLKGSDMVFIAAGAGGGTGTGAAPVVARIAREIGALTVGIVTKPFGFEGNRRMKAADMGVEALGDEVDTLIVVPNNRLLDVLDKKISMVDAFRVADDVLRQGVQGISDLVTLPGLINLDFADVRTIMSEAGNALLGIGMGDGEDRALEAAQQAVSSPLLETSMEGARKILLSITAGRDLSLWEVNEAAKAVAEAAHPEANIIFGAMVDEKLEDQVWVTVVATGFGDTPGRPAARRPIEEPRGEPRVERRTASGRTGEFRAVDTRRPGRSSGGLGVGELDVPEFIPRG